MVCGVQERENSLGAKTKTSLYCPYSLDFKHVQGWIGHGGKVKGKGEAKVGN